MEDSSSKSALEEYPSKGCTPLKGKYSNAGLLMKPAELAPIHCRNSKNINFPNAQSDKKITANSPPKDNDEKSSLANDLHDKLTLKNKAYGINGMKLGTTDVEVHYGPSVTSDCEVRSNNFPVKSNEGVKCPNEPCNNSTQVHNSSQEQFVNSASTSCSNAISAVVSHCAKQAAGHNGNICNGHTVSEATSTNSIAISDLSISSEKSADSYSCSGARPRIRNESNSSSQSTQPRSDVDISFTSDASKLLERLSESNVQDSSVSLSSDEILNMEYINYENEYQMGDIMKLIQKDLSEPYSIYTYRYFIHNWPKLCFLAICNEEVVGAIVCKLDMHKKSIVRGYIAMLAVDERYRKKRIGSNLVQRAIRAMAADEADEVVLETEITNKPALQLYENLGFVRDKRLFRYYLNGVDALRLKLWLR